MISRTPPFATRTGGRQILPLPSHYCADRAPPLYIHVMALLVCYHRLGRNFAPLPGQNIERYTGFKLESGNGFNSSGCRRTGAQYYPKPWKFDKYVIAQSNQITTNYEPMKAHNSLFSLFYCLLVSARPAVEFCLVAIL